MEIILKQDVANLGYKDDIVTVKNGYANNYLLPQGKAAVWDAAEAAPQIGPRGKAGVHHPPGEDVARPGDGAGQGPPGGRQRQRCHRHGV